VSARRRKKPAPRPRHDARTWRAAEAVVGALAPLEVDDRQRVLAAAAVLLGATLEVAGRKIGALR
jgi:hypothetical protein